MLFTELPLKPDLLKGVEALGFTQPTPVQKEAIPVLITEQKDLIGLAQTGTGKTAAFGLPMIQRIDVKKNIFGFRKSVFRNFSLILEGIDNFRRQNQFPREILLQIHLF